MTDFFVFFVFFMFFVVGFLGDILGNDVGISLLMMVEGVSDDDDKETGDEDGGMDKLNIISSFISYVMRR
jgi:hypothetical protein